jgi:hypothetical protein
MATEVSWPQPMNLNEKPNGIERASESLGQANLVAIQETANQTAFAEMGSEERPYVDCQTCSQPALHVCRPLSVVVLGRTTMLLRTPVGILPEINIPFVSIIWTYAGLVREEIGGQRLVASVELIKALGVWAGGNTP